MPGFPNNPKKLLLLHDGAHPGIQVSIGIGVTQQQKKKGLLCIIKTAQ